MIPYHWLKNIGLSLLVAIQLGTIAIAWHQIDQDQHIIDQISKQQTRSFETLSRLERVSHEAYTLFIYDITDNFVTVNDISAIIANCITLTDFADQLPAEAGRQSLNTIQRQLREIQLALGLLDSARSQFISDTPALEQRISQTFSALFDTQRSLYDTLAPEFDSPLDTRLQNLDALSQVAEETYQQYLNTPIHQPQVIVTLLRQLLQTLEVLEQQRFHSCSGDHPSCQQIKTIRINAEKICNNLPGIYTLWVYDPNLSYLGDEVRILNQTWDDIHSAMNVLLHSEKKALEEEKEQLIRQMDAGKFTFIILAVVGFSSAVLFTIVLSRILHVRLNRVVIGIQEFSRGNRLYRLETSGQDQIATVAHEFNAMADQLHSQEQRLQQSQQLLEERVIERTSDLQQANERLILMDQVFKNAREAILVLDAQGKIIQVNPEFIRLTGFPAESILGRHPGLFKQVTEQSGIHRRLPNNSESLWEGEIILNNLDNTPIATWVSVSSFDNHRGSTAGYIALFHDLRKIKEQEEQIRHQALHDALTGLPNRMLMADRLSIAIAQAKRSERKVGVLFLDLDNFKKINDSLGHAVGDELLIAISNQLKEAFRDEDTVCRLGGDEFIIILGNITATSSIYDLAERLLHRLSTPLPLKRHTLHISTSIGIAIYPDNGNSVNELLKNADMAMYAAKEKGKNTISTFSATMDEALQQRLAMEDAIRAALDQDQFEIYYQPQISVDGTTLLGAEGLVRWIDPQRGIIPPLDFIPLCEETGLIHPLGEKILSQVFHYAARFCAQEGHRHYRFSVNVSPRQFSDPNFLTLIKTTLQRSQARPENLEIEITESSMMQDINHTRTVLTELKDIGISIAIDDFGTGYSSLTHLKHFPIQTLKIDRSFIKDIPQDREDLRLVETIVSMAHHLGIKLVGEGVETLDQLDVLNALGCQTVQGFLFSPPVTATQFEQFARDMAAKGSA
jgi:diguanylate cyclase (GGDEF)-like protein/PAS domain S-box-containing protein